MAGIGAITDADRETAALICAIGASHSEYICVADIERAMDMEGWGWGCSSPGDLARRAYHSPTAAVWPMYAPERYAEAEALLRTGWVPS